MKNLLSNFVDYFEKSEDFRKNLVNYDRFLKSPEGKFFKDVLQTIIGLMATDMFSRTHAVLRQEEKDMVQRTYYHLHKILSFLMEPRNHMEKKLKWRLSGLKDFRDRVAKTKSEK